MTLLRLLPFLACLCLTPAAYAQGQIETLEIGDVELELHTSEDLSQTLLRAGQIITADDRILAGEQMAVGDAFVRVLHVGSGGSLCSGALRVLWARGTEVGVSEKTDPCLYPEVAPSGDGLDLRVRPLPAQPGAAWRWSMAGGLEALPDQPFVPNPDQGWQDFSAMANRHPIEMLSFAPVYAQFRAALSEQDFSTLAQSLNELGSGAAMGQGYEGEACAKWECDSRFAYLWIDTTQQQAYAFWRVDGNEFAFPLPLKDWPQWVVLRAAEKLEARD